MIKILFVFLILFIANISFSQIDVYKNISESKEVLQHSLTKLNNENNKLEKQITKLRTKLYNVTSRNGRAWDEIMSKIVNYEVKLSFNKEEIAVLTEKVIELEVEKKKNEIALLRYQDTIKSLSEIIKLKNDTIQSLKDTIKNYAIKRIIKNTLEVKSNIRRQFMGIRIGMQKDALSLLFPQKAKKLESIDIKFNLGKYGEEGKKSYMIAIKGMGDNYKNSVYEDFTIETSIDITRSMRLKPNIYTIVIKEIKDDGNIILAEYKFKLE